MAGRLRAGVTMEVLPGLRLSDHDGFTRRGAEAHGPEGYRSPEGHGSMVETDSTGPSPRAERFEEQLADARAARREARFDSFWVPLIAPGSRRPPPAARSRG